MRGVSESASTVKMAFPCTLQYKYRSGAAFRPHEHDQLSTFHFGLLQDNTVVANGVGDLVQRRETDGLRIDDLTSPESHCHFYFIFIVQEFFYFFDLKVKIMLLGLGPELDFLGFDHCLPFFASCSFFFCS